MQSLERPCASLALKVFTITNAADLQCLGPFNTKLENWEGTSTFITLICIWWNIVNVQHSHKGRNTSNKAAYPISQIDDDRLELLLKLRDWLDAWKVQSNSKDEGFLTQDTYFAFQHTLKVLVEVVRDLLSESEFAFVLTGKFQTNDSESRFGQYRQMCGGNRLVSIQEVMEKEKN